MARIRLHPEHHLVGRIGWLRAAVLGANDGILSTASLIVGVAAAAATKNAVLLAGVAGLVAGAMSMATGEYVSVSSQSDTEQADLARERNELRDNIEFEKEELAQIYVKRGLEPSLARKVAQQLMAKDALAAHARDELGISEITTARPVQAALTSALTFSGRRGFAFAYGRHIADRCNCPGSVCCVFGISRASRCNRGKSVRRQCSPRHRPSDVLWSAGDGCDRRNWEGVRDRCLKICPLSAQSGHHATEFQCALSGVNRTLSGVEFNGQIGGSDQWPSCSRETRRRLDRTSFSTAVNLINVSKP
jgi:hypothetical protein